MNPTTIISGAAYQSIKTGDLYSVIAVAKDYTNNREEEYTVFYLGGKYQSDLYSRESNEFATKFKYVGG